MPAEARAIDEQVGDVKTLRRAYRRVFDPYEWESATPQDREAVAADLKAFCNYDTPFSVQVGYPDVGFQLAVQEGRRAVLLRILGASRKSREEEQAEPESPYQAKTE